MTLTFTELVKIIAGARGLPDDFWKQNPLYIRLAESRGPGSAAHTISYLVARPHTGIGSFNVDVSKDDEALGIEFI